MDTVFESPSHSLLSGSVRFDQQANAIHLEVGQDIGDEVQNVVDAGSW